VRKPAKEETIKIGALLPLTGNAAYVGQDIKTAIEVAVEDLSGEGIEVKIIYEDHQGNPTMASSGALKLISQEVDGLFVAMSSPSAAIAPIAEKNKILTLIDSSADDPASAHDHVFKDYSSLYYDCKMLYEHVKNEEYNVGAFLPNFESGRECEKGIKEINKDVYIEFFNLDSSDFRTQITKLKSKELDFLILYGLKDNLVNIFQQIRQLDYSPKIGCLSLSVTCGAQEVKDAAFDLLDEALGTQSKASIDPDNEIFNEFSKKFTQKRGSAPSTDYTIYAYDDVILMGRVLKECNKDVKCAKEKLYNLSGFKGAGGTLEFNSDGVGERESIILEYKNGQFVPYEE